MLLTLTCLYKDGLIILRFVRLLLKTPMISCVFRSKPLRMLEISFGDKLIKLNGVQVILEPRRY